MRGRNRRLLAAFGCAVSLSACSDAGTGGSAEAQRGRQIYLAQCVVCHADDPAQNGPLGPAVKGSSPQLLEARVVRGTYPPGYTPKRNTAVMQSMPHLASSVSDLAAYLR
ncbi:MAG: c-type cytochrome [Candidatus Rokuibacteriota bacterium]